MDDENDLRGHRKLAAEMIKLWLFSFYFSPPPPFFHILNHVSVLLPLAANADEDNKDGDHKGGCCRDGSQEQQVLVGGVVEI